MIDPVIDVFPAAQAFRNAKSELLAWESRYEQDPSEALVQQIRAAQTKLESARAELRRATRL